MIGYEKPKFIQELQNNIPFEELYIEDGADDYGTPYSNFLDSYDAISQMNITDSEIMNLFGRVLVKEFISEVMNFNLKYI